MEEKVLGSQEIKPAETPKIGGIQVSPAPTAGVDMNFYANSSPTERISAGQSTPEQSADPWNKASDIIQKVSDNGLNQINQNHIDTIGTERGGQQSLNVAGAGDTYMTGRYSSPMVANLVSSFRTTAAQNALSTELENEKKRLTDEVQKAYKARQKRDRARAEAAARAAAQQAQQQAVARQIAGMGNVQGEKTTETGQVVRYADPVTKEAFKYKEKMEELSRSDKPEESIIPQLEEFRNDGISNIPPKTLGKTVGFPF